MTSKTYALNSERSLTTPELKQDSHSKCPTLHAQFQGVHQSSPLPPRLFNKQGEKVGDSRLWGMPQLRDTCPTPPTIWGNPQLGLAATWIHALSREQATHVLCRFQPRQAPITATGTKGYDHAQGPDPAGLEYAHTSSCTDLSRNASQT